MYFEIFYTFCTNMIEFMKMHQSLSGRLYSSKHILV